MPLAIHLLAMSQTLILLSSELPDREEDEVRGRGKDWENRVDRGREGRGEGRGGRGVDREGRGGREGKGAWKMNSLMMRSCRGWNRTEETLL